MIKSDKDIVVSVVGVGFVGQSVARGLNLFAKIKTYDVDPRKSANSFEDAMNADLIFVCLPTPMETAEGGACDLSIIESFFQKASEAAISRNTIFIIKSTVPVGTTSYLENKYKLRIVHNPEFLTARSALIDFLTPARNIVGGNDKEAVETVSKFLQNRFPGIACYTMKPEESELVKYIANCFFATKVIFFNEMRLLSDKLNLDWDKLIQGVISDGRIAKSHYEVPGHDGDRGVGGFCFPKDINALISTFEKNNLEPLQLKATWEQNKRVRKNWDWAVSPSAVSNKKKDK